MGEEDQYAAFTYIESRIFYNIPGFFWGGGVQRRDVQTFAQKYTRYCCGINKHSSPRQKGASLEGTGCRINH